MQADASRRRVEFCESPSVRAFLLSRAREGCAPTGDMDYGSDSLPFGFRSRLVFTRAALRRCFSVRNILADL